ncbi:MAG: amidohydrolase family protein [Imperialibacter sp.]|uniref:amidohydrolase family protein n=1 Tax=Imperialibacter sp. TaxID=2038411 RepID=UPI0032EADF36
MPKIDAHQHFWKYDPARHGWIGDSMKVIQRDFMPNDLEPVLHAHGIEGCVLVQVDQNQQENEFQLANAQANDFIKGVVGWVDLQAEDIEQQLASLSKHKKLKGFRHILQGEDDDAFMLRSAFRNGIGKLSKFGFTYDILIFPKHLKNACKLVKEFPDQPFVLDHLAKPYIKAGKIEEWKKDIGELAQFENVMCKVSGMVTEADWKNWQKADFRPYLDAAVEGFGMDRLMFGSDWPVCLCAADYTQVVDIVDDYFSSFSKSEQAAFWGGNAARFYNLE